MSIHITWEDANRILDEIIAEFGEDYVYPGAGNPDGVVDWEMTNPRTDQADHPGNMRVRRPRRWATVAATRVR
jgi:hypothetical protein